MKHLNSRTRADRERGQTMTIVLMVLGLFLLGAIGLAVDVSNWWFHRQMAQGASDAACTAGIMDMLVNATGGTAGGFPTGSPPASFSCNGNPGAAVCAYANLNGYNGGGRLAGQASNDVNVSFPGSVPGLSSCSTSPPPCIPTTVANPLIQVDILDRVPTTFTGLLTGSRTTDVAGSSVCGILQATAPVPIIVLNPTCPHAFEISGSTNVSIVGGPSRSIQVNSSNTTCAAATTSTANGCSASPACSTNSECIDLSQGGQNFKGSDFGVFGAPGSAPGPFKAGLGHWVPGASPISDPFANTPAPARPTASPTDGLNCGSKAPAAGTGIAHNTHGCPDDHGCIEFEPGLYTKPIVVQGCTAIFDPGIYYIEGTNKDNSGTPGSGCVSKPTGQSRYGLDVDSLGVVRPADPNDNLAGNTKDQGVMLYLSGASGAGSYGSVFFGSNAGKAPGGHTIDQFQTDNAVCPGGKPIDSQLKLAKQVDGNVLLGMCTSGGTFLGGGSTDTSGTIRGLVFFQNRANADLNGQASMQGGGGLIISGNMYFHNCNSSGTGTGCSDPPTGFNAFLQLQGNPGGAAYVLGNITTDQFVLSGNGNIAMALNPNAVYHILKASLLQ